MFKEDKDMALQRIENVLDANKQRARGKLYIIIGWLFILVGYIASFF